MRSRSKLGAGLERILEVWWAPTRAAIRTAMPAFVTGYDHAKREATVQPTIKTRYSDGRPLQDAAPLRHRPVMQVARGGGWLISHGLKDGDQVLVVCCDRATDTWQPSLGDKTVAPKRRRYHDASDSVILPGVSASKPPTAGAADELYLGGEDGAVSIRMSPSGKITIANKLASVEVDAAGGITLSPGPGQATKVGGDASSRRAAMNVEVKTSLAALAGLLKLDGALTKPTKDALEAYINGLTSLIGSPNLRDT